MPDVLSYRDHIAILYVTTAKHARHYYVQFIMPLHVQMLFL